MSGAAPAIRELIGFDGSVACDQQPDSATLRLRGEARGGCGAAEVWFSNASVIGARRGEAMTAAAAPDAAPALPSVLQRVSVLELDPGSTVQSAPGRAFRIETSGGSFELHATSVQVHREVGREFFGAVPPARVPRATRLGWALLLGLLRMPGAVRLLTKLRG